MNFRAVNKIIHNSGTLIMCEDAEGVQYFGTKAALYRADGWPHLSVDEVKAVFETWDEFGGIRIKEKEFPMNGTYTVGERVGCMYETMLTTRAQQFGLAETTKGIVLLDIELTDAVDIKGNGKNVVLRECADKDGNIAIGVWEKEVMVALIAPYDWRTKMKKEIKRISRKKLYQLPEPPEEEKA